MAYCKYCGKELVNGKCACNEFQDLVGNTASDQQQNNQQQQNQQSQQQQYQQPQYQQQSYKQQSYKQQDRQPYYKSQQGNDPFVIPSFDFDFSSASRFFSSLKDLIGLSESSNDKKDPFEHNVPIVPDCIPGEEDEIVVKQYNIAKLRTRLKCMEAEGRLMVTNKRVLFRAAGTSLKGNLLQEHQFDINEIGGIEIHKDYKFSFLSFFGCLLLYIIVAYLAVKYAMKTSSGGTITNGVMLGILGLLPNFIVYKRFWLKYFCSVIVSASFIMALSASIFYWSFSKVLVFFVILSVIFVLINMIIVSYVPNLVIKIKSKSANGAVVIGGQSSLHSLIMGLNYSGFGEVLPWEDTDLAMNELGTMIDDLQKQGDIAIKKWKK